MTCKDKKKKNIYQEEYNKQYRLDNKEKLNEYNRQYHRDHKEEINEQKEQYYQDNKEKVLKRCKKYYQKNKERIDESHKNYNFKNKDKIKKYAKNRHLVRTYGITTKQLVQTLKNQDNKCAICGNNIMIQQKNYAMDHDHSTGKLRGILCFQCNAGLGSFNDDPDTMIKAMNYLKKWEENHHEGIN